MTGGLKIELNIIITIHHKSNIRQIIKHLKNC